MDTTSPYLFPIESGGPAVCRNCQSPIPAEEPLGGGVCEACLWQELISPSAGGLVFCDLIQGYVLHEELGRGGMGVVYRARQKNPGRDVALKMLQPLESGRLEIRERFYTEAAALAELDHPAILPIYDAGETDGIPYFTMKLAKGGSLAERLKLEQIWPPARAAELIAVIAGGVQHAHNKSIIHRDIKPGNILFDETGHPFIADFGLARLGEAGSMTRSAGVLGTLAYLAPEISIGGAKAATAASDIYGLGTVLYELLAGRPPFVIEGMAAMLRKVAEDDPEKPSTINGLIPKDLEVICLKCLRKEPADRYGSAAALADDLNRWMRGEPVLARRLTVVQRTAKWAKRRPAVAGLSAACLVLMAGGAWTLLQKSRAEEESVLTRQTAEENAEKVLGPMWDLLYRTGDLPTLEAALRTLLAVETGGDVASLKRKVRLQTALGRCLNMMARSGDAGAMLREALTTARKLPQQDDASVVILAAAIAALAEFTADTESYEAAIEQLRAAEQTFSTAPPAARAGLADALTSIRVKSVFVDEDLLQSARTAVALRREAAHAAADTGSRFALAKSLAALGEVLDRWSRRSGGKNGDVEIWKECRAQFAEARDILNQLRAENPGSNAAAYAEWERDLADITGWIGGTDLHLATTAEERAAAEALMREETAMFQRVVDEVPLDWKAALNVVAAEGNLAKTSKEPAEVDAHREKQEELVDRIYGRVPASRAWQLTLMNSDLRLGEWHCDNGRKDEAVRHFDRAMATGQKLVTLRPNHEEDQEGYVRLIGEICKPWERSADYARLEPVVSTALAFAKQQALLVKDLAPAWQWFAAALHRDKAALAFHRNDTAEQLNQNLFALRLRAEALRQKTEEALKSPEAVANAYFNSEKTLLLLDRIGEAVKLAGEAVDLFKESRSPRMNPNPWANAILVAAEAGKKAGGELARDSAALARAALDGLYPPAGEASADGGGVLYVPGPGREEKYQNDAAELKARLSEVAGPEVPPRP